MTRLSQLPQQPCAAQAILAGPTRTIKATNIIDFHYEITQENTGLKEAIKNMFIFTIQKIDTIEEFNELCNIIQNEGKTPSWFNDDEEVALLVRKMISRARDKCLREAGRFKKPKWHSLFEENENE